MTQPQRRMVFAISGSLVMSLFALPHSAFAQASVQNPKSQNSSNQTGAVIRSTSRLVLLDVVVTDKSGKPLPGLNKEDFTVFEDGQPQRISNFETPETHLSENPTADTS